MQILKAGVEKFPGSIGVSKPPLDKKMSNQGSDPQLIRKQFDLLSRAGQDFPVKSHFKILTASTVMGIFGLPAESNLAIGNWDVI
jgi:hypothetical protein